ncbi:MAG: hypothetical protein KGI51_03495 [Rhodospirillales bacterium]|nr:hypothetical protein [Rhodospirillales bacterium]
MTAHLGGDRPTASRLFLAADMPEVRAWTESLWGSARNNPEQHLYIRNRPVPDAPPVLSKVDRVPHRMPNAAGQSALIERYGFNCAFCGIPVIHWEVRAAANRAYPEAVPWGNRNIDQHAAFQCMWMQFDHVLPHSRGGSNALDNFVITCAPCNFGRMENTLDEVGLIDPRSVPMLRTAWDGLERFRGAAQPAPVGIS